MEAVELHVVLPHTVAAEGAGSLPGSWEPLLLFSSRKRLRDAMTHRPVTVAMAGLWSWEEGEPRRCIHEWEDAEACLEARRADAERHSEKNRSGRFARASNRKALLVRFPALPAAT